MSKKNFNNVVWQAIRNLKRLEEQDRLSHIEEIFFTCEKRLQKFNASEKDKGLRLFALAYYCDKTYNSQFFNSAIFPRFSGVFDFSNFEYLAKTLIKENNLALVVFWVVLRLSFKNTVSSSSQLERKMKRRVLGMGLKPRF